MGAFFEPAVANAIVAHDLGKIVVSAAKTIRSQLGTKSLTRSTQDYIFQFPLIISGGIDTDEIQVISKSFERNYASLLVTLLTADGEVNRAKFDSIADYLKTVHTNTSIPEKISNNLILESARISDSDSAVESITFTENDIASMWTITEEQVDMSSLNEIYQPYTRTKVVLEQCLTQMKNSKIATEADTIGSVADDLRHNVSHGGRTTKAKDYSTQFYNAHPGVGAVKQLAEDVNKNSGSSMSDMLKRGKLDPKHNRGGVNNLGTINAPGYIIEDKSLQMLPPTMFNVTLSNYDTTNSSNVMWTKVLTLGSKAMIRLVRSNIMVSNMIEAAKDAPIFTFINWTRGEIKLHDMITGHKKYKAMALPDVNNRWLRDLKWRRASSLPRKIVPGMKQLIPNTTIVITEGEALMIKDACGVDLHDIAEAKRIIRKYFLLAFAIYDTETKILHTLFDQDYNSFISTSLRQLTALVRKDTNLLADYR